MTSRILTILAISLICAGSAHAQSFKRIKKEADFRALVVGKTLNFNGGNAVIHSNGKTDGTLTKNGKYYGAWSWQKGYYCRNLVINKKETGTNCQRVEISGSKLKFVRDKGKGRVTDITIN